MSMLLMCQILYVGTRTKFCKNGGLMLYVCDMGYLVSLCRKYGNLVISSSYKLGFFFNISNATMKQVVKCHVFHKFIFELVVLFGFAFQLLSLIPSLMT